MLTPAAYNKNLVGLVVVTVILTGEELVVDVVHEDVALLTTRAVDFRHLGVAVGQHHHLLGVIVVAVVAGRTFEAATAVAGLGQLPALVSKVLLNTVTVARVGGLCVAFVTAAR